MRLFELEEQINAGVAVRRKSWSEGVAIRIDPKSGLLRNWNTSDYGLHFDGLVETALLFADDWERADGLGRDAADANEDICDLMFTVAMLVKDALNHPGEKQLLEVHSLATIEQVRRMLKRFAGLELFVGGHADKLETFDVFVTWRGDKPSKKQPPSNFKRIVYLERKPCTRLNCSCAKVEEVS